MLLRPQAAVRLMPGCVDGIEEGATEVAAVVQLLGGLCACIDVSV